MGIISSLLVLETGLRVAGFLFVSFQNCQNSRAAARKKTYRIMCLGESTTAGQYPSFLQEALNKRHTGVTFSVIDRGVIATDTPAILRRLEENLATYKPDMVV
ncbi:MAG TPA: hypothetical protein VMD52_00005, partial [Patescibacteria group bacterium]|nr:hypothetical protein [Patescibacteria group bacterium]